MELSSVSKGKTGTAVTAVLKTATIAEMAVIVLASVPLIIYSWRFDATCGGMSSLTTLVETGAPSEALLKKLGSRNQT